MTMQAINDMLTALPPRTRTLAQNALALLRETLPGVMEQADPKAKLIGYHYGPGEQNLVCELLLGAGVRIGFTRSNTLPDPTGLLEGSGKTHRYVHLRSDNVIVSGALADLLGAALAGHQARSGLDVEEPASGISFAALCAAAAHLPGIAASTSYGTPALTVAGKLMLRLIDDGGAVALKCNWDERERLIAANGAVFYVTPHYQAYPWVLIRIARLDPQAVPALLEMAWSMVASGALKLRHPAGAL